MDFKPGTRVKNYTLERQLGRGASGEVWKAYDETKTVAIKFMNESLMTSAAAAKHRARLTREVEALRKLQHPNIPTLYDYDLDFKRPYIAMRFVGGDSYDRLISGGEMLRIPMERRLEMIRDLAFALTAAHEAGIIHRDIKPANLTGIENPYLLDFSISLETEDVEHTQRFVGTTLYMSADGVADRLSDNYSFGVVVYEMLFGKHPIYQLGDSIFNQFIAEMRIQNRQWAFPSTIPQSQLPADLRQADLRKLDAIFERAIGKREQRYVDLREFVRDIRMAIMPYEQAVEEARVASAPPMPAMPHPSVAPSMPPAPAAAPPVAQPPPAPEPAVSAEESNFLDKAFVNLPAVKPSEPPAEPDPKIALEQTSIQHTTVPYDYEAKRRVPVDEPPPPRVGPEDRTFMDVRAAAAPEPEAPVQPEAPAAYAGPEDRTMMEIRVTPPEPSAPSSPPPAEKPVPAPMVGSEDRTMMEIQVDPPAAPPAAEKPAPAPIVGSEDRTMMEFQIEPPAATPPVPSAPPPAAPVPPADEERTLLDIGGTPPPPPQPPAHVPPAAYNPPPPNMSPDATMPEIPVPWGGYQSNPPPPPQQPPASEENFTLLEMQSPRQQQQPQGQGDFTMMEVQGARPARGNDNFTQMEMQSPQKAGIPSPFHNNDNFTLLEMNSAHNPGTSPGKPATNNRTRLLLIAAVVVIIILVVAIIVLVVSGGTSVA